MAAVYYRDGAFPPEGRIDWQALVPLLGPAVAALARYDGALSGGARGACPSQEKALSAVPNPRVLLSPLTTQEAVLSSRIEGTQATMSEVLEFEAGQEVASARRRDDIQEVLNYRAAMHAAEEQLKDVPLGQRVVREAHRVLLATFHRSWPSGACWRIPNTPPAADLRLRASSDTVCGSRLDRATSVKNAPRRPAP